MYVDSNPGSQERGFQIPTSTKNPNGGQRGHYDKEDEMFMQQQQKQIPKRVYCTDTAHRSKDFKKVLDKSTKRRILTLQRLCYNCTIERCRASQEGMSGNCARYGLKHHTFICERTCSSLLPNPTKGFYAIRNIRTSLHATVFCDIYAYRQELC